MPVTCPRCGKPGYLTKRRVKGSYYYYCIHKRGRRIVRQCYVGPVSTYTLVEGVNPLGLTNMLRDERFIEYAARGVRSYCSKALSKYRGRPDKLLEVLGECIALREEVERCINMILLEALKSTGERACA